MKTLLTLFVLFFSSLVSAVEYPYEGDKPILPNLSADAGEDYEYMRLCGGDLYKSAEETRKKVKELSTPDYKLFQKYRAMEFSKNYSHSINCAVNKWLIEANERYLNNLKRSIDNKSNPQNSSKNKILKNSQEIIYVCVDSNGKHSLRNNSNNSSDTSCTSYTNKDTAQKIVESANSKLGKNKYYVCVDPDTRENSLKVDPDLSIDKCTTFQNKNVALNFLDTSNTKLAEEKEQIAEAKRVAEEKRKEEERIAEEKRKEEERIAEEKRKEEERIAEEKRVAEENRIAEEIKQKKLSLIPAQTELEEAQFYLQLIQDFSKIYPNEFDIVELMEYFTSSRPVLDGVFDQTQMENIKKFREFTNSSSNFADYEKKQLDIKIKQSLDEIDKEINLLSVNLDNLKTYMKENMTSNFIPKILEQVKVSQEILSNPNNFTEIINANIAISDLQNEIIKLEEQILLAEAYSKKLNNYMIDNMTSELVPNILEIVNSIKLNIKNPNMEDLITINEIANSFILSKIEITQVTTSSENNIETSQVTTSSDNNIVKNSISGSIPTKQQNFILSVESAKTKKTETDFHVGQVLTTRNTELKKIFSGSGKVYNWIGTVDGLKSNSDGKGVLSILIKALVDGNEKKSFHVQTWNNALSDIFSKTLIEPNDSMYLKMGNLSKGDKVKFSGSFFIDDDGMVETQNLSKKGKINKPQFTFKFSDISKLQ